MGEGGDNRVRDLVQRARELPEEARGAWVRGQCAGDEELRRRVMEALEAEEPPTAILPLSTTMRGESSLKRPEQIGPYRILEVLGEGGFGIVYLAERREPMVQRVALKVIKPGMDTKAVLGRFEAERQALALMDHPNIARVFDAGATPEGRPYFVMEHVPGIPITAHCDRERLTIRQRLELFATVCDAVAHAHMKGIIHRDIKPSNILVSVHESGQGIPKIIDFGVAKATQMRLTERTVFTETGQLIGTPEYMSPEQAEATAQDVDTRTDVYSLGVVLYELLTGSVPFDPKDLRSAGMEEIRRIIREEIPPRPSTKLTTQGEQGRIAAEARRIRLDELERELRTELEWVPLKALRKDRTERYRSAIELGDEVRRYLAGEPLIAGPESLWYRTKKFAGRNRRTLTVGGGFVGVLIALWIAIAWGLRLDDSRYAWVSVDSGGVPCRVFLQTQDPASYRLEAGLRRVGSTPIRKMRMAIGQHRMTVVRNADNAYAEFNLVLKEPGKAAAKSVRVLDAADAAKTVAPAEDLVGVFRSTDELAGAGMLRVLAGQYSLGKPKTAIPMLHGTIDIREFIVDLAQVSNREYKEFVDATGHAPPYHWKFGFDAAADLPVMNVTLEDAEAYARWRGKRLATVFEWQAAARGAAAKLYPGGDDPASVQDGPFEAVQSHDLSLIHASFLALALPTRQPARWDPAGGLLHTFSNVREMTATADISGAKVFCVGRAWCDDPRASTLAQVGAAPLAPAPTRIGFRCAKSVLTPQEIP